MELKGDGFYLYDFPCRGLDFLFFRIQFVRRKMLEYTGGQPSVFVVLIGEGVAPIRYDLSQSSSTDRLV